MNQGEPDRHNISHPLGCPSARITPWSSFKAFCCLKNPMCTSHPVPPTETNSTLSCKQQSHPSSHRTFFSKLIRELGSILLGGILNPMWLLTPLFWLCYCLMSVTLLRATDLHNTLESPTGNTESSQNSLSSMLVIQASQCLTAGPPSMASPCLTNISKKILSV